MGKSKTPSFIVELPLVTNSGQRHVLNTRFEAGRQIYNACLGKAIRCRNQMLQSKLYRSALNMPSSGKQGKEARSRVFREARSKYSFTEYSLHGYVGKIRNSWLGAHIDSFTAQKLATRAFGAVNKTVIGDAGKVHFKRYGELDSLEGKSNRTGIRWRDGYVEWTGLKLRAIIDINETPPI